MKYKLLYAGIMLVVICCSVLLLIDPKHSVNARVHQHLSSPEKQACQYEDESCTHLPIISIHTNGQEIPFNPDDKATIVTQVDIYDSSNYENSLLDEPDQQIYANIRTRGNSSFYFRKHSYYFQTSDKYGIEKNEKLLGLPKHDNWVLNGPFLDKTMIRNYMFLNIAGEIFEYAPNVRYCELWINDEFQGLYILMETVSRGKHRVPIEKYNSKDAFTSYIIRLDRGDLDSNELTSFSEYAMKIHPDTENYRYAINVEYPSTENLTPKIKEYIEKDLSKIEKAIYSFDYDDSVYGYEELLNVDSFVNYFIFNEFTQNNDAGLFSTYFYKDVRGKLTVGPVWDFNNAADNFMEQDLEKEGFGLAGRYLFNMLLKEEAFVERVIHQYYELRKSVLSEENLLNYIDETVAYLGDAIDRNYVVWEESFNYDLLTNDEKLNPKERNPKNYEEAINQLKTSIIDRGRWLDENIGTLRQYCHESKVKKFNH